MARIVPARPVSAGPSVEAAVAALEQGLDDGFVVFQRGALPGSLLVGHPERGFCAVACSDAASARWDADTECWDGADSQAAAAASSRRVGGVTVPGVAFVPGGIAPGGPPYGVATDAAALSGLVVEAARQGRSPSPGQAGMDAAIQAFSPGAAPYARGTVTPAQEAWRAGRTAPGEPAADAIQPFLPPPRMEQQGRAQAVAERDAPFELPLAFPGVDGPEDGSVALPRAAAEPAGQVLEADNPVVLLLRQAAEATCSGRTIVAAGIEITAAELVDPKFMLPALLVSAIESWAPAVVKSGGQGGFTLRLRTDQDAVLGYRVTAIEPSAPMLLVLPVIRLIRSALAAKADGTGDIVIDPLVAQFVRWLEANRLNTEITGDYDVNMAFQQA